MTIYNSDIFISKDKELKIALFHFHPPNVSRYDEIFRYEMKKNVEYEKRMLKYMFIANLNTMQLSLKTEKMNFFYTCMYTKKKEENFLIAKGTR